MIESTNRRRKLAAAICAVVAVALLQIAFQAQADEAFEEAPITNGDRAHWAFSPVVLPKLPEVIDADWLRTPVDSFIRRHQQQKNVSPAGEAGRSTLLRRLSFDLTGLPPTQGELSAFENDASPDAYERLVDRLLASPAFGERQAQHWLDLARFAETDGYEHDKLRADAWQYRDWVIAALNADLPYDEFVLLQLAGDEAERSRFNVQGSKLSVPTMFCLAGPDMPDINDQAERRHNRLNEVTAAVGSVFLGLQLGCAQCHDHKYDPLSQADFYRLRAVFESAVPPLKRDVPYNVLAAQADVEPARLWLRGDHRRPGPELPPGFPRIASTPARSASEGVTDADATPSLALRVSLRTELAHWLSRDDNPLTSRVMANRMWQHHFGRGIVETPSDFGVLGAAPTHPELLDWLARELRMRDWSLKSSHRTIVCSATYRQASVLASGKPVDEQKANTEFYARFPRRRLDGEAIRDALLSAADLLTTERGGPGVMPPLPEELVGTLLKGQWKASEREADHYRRSIYVFARRNLRYPVFEAFDRPDGNASCALRSRSTTAPQSLVLLNSELSLLAARQLAARVMSASDEPAEQIERLYRLCYGRAPTAGESERLIAFVAQQRERQLDDNDSTDAALIDACLALFNSSEFLYID
jgi:hypothetical protein